MNILMTGATGWIGRQLGLHLVRKGHHLTCLVRNPAAAQKNCPFPAEWVKWSDEDSLGQMTFSRQIDCVVHLAGESIAEGSWTDARKEKILHSRKVSTQNLVTLANRLRISNFISTSAIGFYGNRAEDTLDETSASGEGFLAEVCKVWEAPLQALSAGTRSAVIRVGIVLGEGGGALEKMLIPFRLGVGGKMGSGRQWMSWIHFDDLQQVFLKVIEDASYKGVFNATAPCPVRQMDFAEKIAMVMKTNAFVPTPAFVLRIALGEMSQLVLDSAKVLPQRLKEKEFQYQYNDLEVALEQILKHERNGERLMVCEQYIDHPIEKVFPFFADEMNLEKITPPFLNFKVLSKSTPTIVAGTLIYYQLSLRGIPFGWTTEIETWNPPNEFVDMQVKGPYRLWHHTHSFERLGRGTLIRDRVRYKLPLGTLGAVVAGSKVKGDVAKIFEHRRQIIAENFGGEG